MKDIDNTKLNNLSAINICVVGGGFVGLVTAAGLAEFGNRVVCVENNQERLSLLLEGRIPFYESDLQDLIGTNVRNGRLSFASDLEQVVGSQKLIFTAVGTPSSEDGRTDRSDLELLFRKLGDLTRAGQIIVLKSTVPIGTGMKFRNSLLERRGEGKHAEVINNPEFLREGNAVYDFMHPRRIVIGGEDHQAMTTVADIYRNGISGSVPILQTDSSTAEMIKYASNAYLANKVGFINELAGLCDKVGIDVLKVAEGMGLDPRIGPDFLKPGPGWGGSCFGKDLAELNGMAVANDHPLVIMKAVADANRRQHQLVVEKVKSLTGDLTNAKVAVLGLTFKAGTSDMRDSPTIPIIKKLIEGGATVRAYDPIASSEAAACIPDISIVNSAVEAADGADCILLLTEWPEFYELDLPAMRKNMRAANIVDARNIVSPDLARKHGFKYVGMGRQ